MTEKTNARRFFFFFAKVISAFATVLLFSSISVQRAEAANYLFWLGDTQVTSDNASNILGEINPENGEPTASYNIETHTLTLNGVCLDETKEDCPTFSGTSYISSSVRNAEPGYCKLLILANVNIEVKGENILCTKDYSHEEASYERKYTSYAILIGASVEASAKAPTVTFTGNGRITAKGEAPYPYHFLDDIVVGSCYGFYSTGTTIWDGPTFWAESTKVPGGIRNCGIYTPYGSGDFTLNSGTIYGISGGIGITPTPWDAVACGISLYNVPVINGGRMYAHSDAIAVLEDRQVTGHSNLNRVIREDDPCAYLSGKGEYGLTSSYWTILGPSGATAVDNESLSLLGTANEQNINPDDVHIDPDINVWGFTEDVTVYSVDVEWGAMTFQYEKSSWDSESHTKKDGRGWLVYDAANEKVLKSEQDAINQVTVTNHSNADVYATLAYTGEAGYTETTGGFSKKDDDMETNFTEASEVGEDEAKKTIPAYLTLPSADNKLGELEGQGKETVGTVYFMPVGIARTGDTVNDITQWTKIGTITVGLATENPNPDAAAN